MFKKKMLNWLRPFGIFCFLDNQAYGTAPHLTECLAAAGATATVSGSDIREADAFTTAGHWTFGHLAYSLKQSLHQLPDNKEDRVGFPPFFFFHPQTVVELSGTTVTVHSADPAAVFNAILQQPTTSAAVAFAGQVQQRLTQSAYLQAVHGLQAHIHRGDCYEINFCQEFFAEDAQFDAFAGFEKLMQVSPNPFSAFYRLHDRYLLCASPERFLAKKSGRLYSQPIKGTAKRNLQSTQADAALAAALRQSKKEQAENVMVVDLVRNDLTRICKEASVRVDELFGLYSFPQVHQLISTVSGEPKEGLRFSEMIAATFPMGSMTGAPKHRVMQLIDAFEPTARGLFSGSVGYIRPSGDFDFNVVIRSLLFNAANRYLSYQAGSGITFYSDAEKEWEECLLKAEAMQKVLGDAAPLA